MGLPISLSGFNNIDFSAMLNAVMRQERRPLLSLQTQEIALKAQDTEFGTLATKLGALQTAVKALAAGDAFGARTSTNTDKTALSVTMTGDAQTDTYDVVVNELARAQMVGSNSSHSDKDTTIVATGGTLTIGGKTVTLSSGVTLEGLADAINATPGVPVTATIVSPTTGSYQLVLTGNDTGSSNSFLITNSLTGGAAPVTFIDTDTDGTSGDSAADNTVQATDAQVVVNGVSVTTSTNTIESAIPGATLTLLKEDSGSTITVTIGQDTESTKTLVDDFVTAYEDLVSYTDGQKAAARAGQRNNIGRHPLLRALGTDMRQTLTASYAVGGSFTRLAEAGLGFDAAGTLQFSKSTFDTEAVDKRADLEKLFRGGAGQDGVFVALESLIDDYTRAGGLLAELQDRGDDKLRRVGQRIDDAETRLASRRSMLHQQYIATDLAMFRLNADILLLGALGRQFRLF